MKLKGRGICVTIPGQLPYKAAQLSIHLAFAEPTIMRQPSLTLTHVLLTLCTTLHLPQAQPVCGAQECRGHDRRGQAEAGGGWNQIEVDIW